MSDNKPFILISNDDGIAAPGIKHLWKSLKDNYKLAIVAPNSEKSGSGMATTLFKPLHIFNVKWEDDTPAWRITGTPTDSIKIALSSLLERKPDLIVSGINRGSNAGRNIFYSGTIGCVMEGTLRNIPGIAFSCANLDSPHYEKIEKYIPLIVDYFLKNKPAFGTFINVTFPEKSLEIKGFKLTKQGKSRWKEAPDKRLHPEGHHYYWLGGEWHEHEDDDKDSDTYLLNHGYITAVPVSIAELTDLKFFEDKKKSFEKLFDNFSV